MFALSRWPRGGRHLYNLLVATADEVAPELEARPAWQWRWLVWRAVEIEMISRWETQGQARLTAELWRLRFTVLGHGEQAAYMLTAQLDLPGVTFYRVASYVDHDQALKAADALRHVRQAIRTMS